MENFDGWTTDPAVTWIGGSVHRRPYPDRASLPGPGMSPSPPPGTTGTPAVFVHDLGAMSVYQGLLLARRLPTLIGTGAFRPFLRNRARTATIITTGGHFASSVVEALFRSRHPGLAGRNRTFSLMAPLPELVMRIERLFIRRSWKLPHRAGRPGPGAGGRTAADRPGPPAHRGRTGSPHLSGSEFPSHSNVPSGTRTPPRNSWGSPSTAGSDACMSTPTG